MNDNAKNLQDLDDRLDGLRRNPTMRLFYDTSEPLLRWEKVNAISPDGSVCCHGYLVKCHSPVWTADPDLLSNINARIATMDLSPHRRTWEIESERVYGGIWLYDIGRGNMKGGGGPWITD